MNILYGIQGTGNGHLSRAESIYKLLSTKADKVDVLLSGNNYSLTPAPFKNTAFLSNAHLGLAG